MNPKYVLLWIGWLGTVAGAVALAWMGHGGWAIAVVAAFVLSVRWALRR